MFEERIACMSRHAREQLRTQVVCDLLSLRDLLSLSGIFVPFLRCRSVCLDMEVSHDVGGAGHVTSLVICWEIPYWLHGILSG